MSLMNSFLITSTMWSYEETTKDEKSENVF